MKRKQKMFFVKNLLCLLLSVPAMTWLHAQTNVSGNQSGTWTKANSPYIITSSILVPDGQTLTIQAGVEVRSLHYDDKLEVQGILTAIGTISDSIKFNGFSNTAYNDSSSHGGIILLNSDNPIDSSVLAYVSINQMGDKNFYGTGAIEIDNGVVTIRNSCIRNSEQTGIYEKDVPFEDPIVTNVKFANNPVAAYMYPTDVGSFANNINVIITFRGSSSSFTKTSTIPKAGPNSYYLLEKMGNYVFDNCKLIIQPGVEIKFPTNVGFRIGLNASLLAKGTVSDSIKFIGLVDTLVSPSATHNGFITIDSRSAQDTSLLEYVLCDHLGVYPNAINPSAIQFFGLGIVRNCTIRDCENIGITDGYAFYTNLIVTNVVFQNTPIPAYMSASNVGGFSNISNAAITLYENQYDYFTIPKLGTNTYYKLANPSNIHAAVLTIQPGVEIRSTSYADKIVSAILIAKGTATDSIKFIGFSNTAYNPLSSHGGRLIINAYNKTDSSILDYVVLDRMGDKDKGDTGAIKIINGLVTIRNSSIRNSEKVAIYGGINLTTLKVERCNIFNNKYGGQFLAGKPVFSQCNIYKNATYGIENRSTTTTDTIDARTCWWGSTTGPRQTSTNPSGLGNPVTTRVLYNPYLTAVRSDTTPIKVSIGIDSIITPIASCNLTAAETIRIKIRNYSLTAQSGFNVSYRINADSAITENVGALSVAANSTAYYSFSAKANLATGSGTIYKITASAANIDDTIANSTLAKITLVNNKPNLGKDSTVFVCPGSKTNITTLYTTTGFTTVTWNTSTPTNVSQGNYRLIVTNSFGCKDTALITVAANPKPNLGNDTTVTTNTCSGSSGNITNVYNTAGYTSVAWSTPRPDSVTTSGNYTLIVTSSLGCKDTAVVTVVLIGGAAITSAVTTTNAGCFGGTNGSVKVTPTNGVSPYLYKIGTSGTYQSNNLFKNLRAGNYTIYIKDFNNCPGNTNPIAITQYAQLAASFTKTDATCIGKADGTIQVTVTGGKPPYQYRLGTSGIYKDPSLLTGLLAGTYTVYVRDVAGCTGTTALITVGQANVNCLHKPAFINTANTETHTSFDISLSPNPSSNAFTLLVHADNAKPVQVKVLDVNGKALYETKGQPEQAYRFGSSFSPGTYLVEVRQGDEVKTLKVVKMK